MERKARKANRSFLTGTALLGIAVIVVVFVFLLYSINLMQGKAKRPSKDTFTFELADGFRGGSYDFYLNDSLLWSGQVGTDTVCFSVNRFAEENTLLIVNQAHNGVYFMELPYQKGSFLLYQKEGEYSHRLK